MTYTAHRIGLTVDRSVLLRDISLEIHAGELLGIIGPNGAGKSTLVRALAGLERLDAGTILSDGAPLQRLSARARATRVSFVGQDTAVAADITVRELALMGRYAHQRRFARTSTDDADLADTTLARVGIAHLSERSVLTLSGGERQLAQIARALTQGADVLLLDEPTSALDIRHQLRVFDMLRHVARAGTAVGVVLHDVREAARYCDRIAVIHNGELVAHGPPNTVLTRELFTDVYRVDARVQPGLHGAPQIDLIAPIDAPTSPSHESLISRERHL